ncbi:MAG: hypothetical protein QOK37_285 [Thermoanaerobaculia bacterium]|jgi:hypothetical protein|nr:hypothetical protein [Thermoanaerobaculia bacterium]
MTCLHEVHIRAPADAALFDERVCLACGIVGRLCERCEHLHPLAPISCFPAKWCHACDCCGTCCTETEQTLTPADIVAAIERTIHSVTEDAIPRAIRAAATREEAIQVARRQCSLGGSSCAAFSVSGFRDRFNKGRGLTAEFGHRKGLVTWAAIADYVRAPQPCASATIDAQQLSLFA